MRRTALSCIVATLASLGAAASPSVDLGEPEVVVAMIDTGINPYSAAFRDPSPLAQQHPSTYIQGYPPACVPELDVLCSKELRLTLDAASYEDAVLADAEVWENVAQNTLYWIPGTKIIGAISITRGGTSCGNAPEVPPAGGVVNGFFCSEHTILDDAGHGTMTSSRATAADHSLGSGARVVMIEGLGAPSVDWAADQRWIDVQSNSWASLLPAPVAGDVSTAFEDAAKVQLVFAASGNGLGFTHGFAPMPSQLSSTGPTGVVIVGAHDNGRVTLWHGAPPHVVTDGYGGYTGWFRDLDPPRPLPIACCTSAAAPYAAGGAAAIALEARRILGDTGVGVRDGAVAIGPTGLVPSGPLADGVLTLDEWRRVLLATAEARPAEGVDDGLLHFTGGPKPPEHLAEHGPGENPFCEGCWTLPIRWTEVASEVPAYLSIGYGAVNERSVELAARVLSGAHPLPARPDEDSFFALDEQIRGQIHR